MKNWFIYLTILSVFAAACTKEPAEVRMAKLFVEGNGNYLITFGTVEPVTIKGENNWTTTFNVNPGDTIRLSVKTTNNPATIYLNVELQQGLLYCTSLYVRPESSGVLNHVVSEQF